MIRNFIFGCLTVTVLLLVVLGIGGYFLVWQPAQAFLQNFSAPQTQAQNQTPQNTTAQPATPRENVVLTRPQVQAFVRIRRSVREAVGQDFTRFDNIYQDVASGQAPGALELWNAMRDASGVLNRARTAQQAGLTREKMSARTYAEVRREVNRALSIPEIDLGTAARALQNGQLPNWNEVVVPPSEGNAALIRPFTQELRRTAALGLLGL